MYRGYLNIIRFLGLGLLAWVFLRFALPLCLPFLLGGLIALAAEPLVRFLRNKCRLPAIAASALGVSAALCILAALVVLLLALLLREVGVLMAILPDLEQTALSGLQTLSGWVLSLISRLPEGLQGIVRRSTEDFLSGGSALLHRALSWALSFTGGILSQVPDSAFVIFTALISGYMFSVRMPGIRTWLRKNLSRERIRKLLELLSRIKTTLIRFFKAQLKLMGITWIILFLGFVLLRIPYAPVWAAAVALVDAFPILGTGTVLLPWSLICFLRGDSPRGLGLLGIYSLITLGRSVLEPKILGSQLGLDPLLTLGSIYAGYRLWGFGGMILAPVLAVVAVQVLRPENEGQ